MGFEPDISRSSLDRLSNEFLNERGIRLLVKRDDLIDPDISGNKWRKLKYNILQCNLQKNSGVLTFGGAFSNHLVATAAACNKAGLSSVGVVRGDELNPESNETLRRCSSLGMQLHFVSREEYHLRYERYYHEELLQIFPNHYVVPEGGANYFGMIGCQEILTEIDREIDYIVLAQGTTTTSCGILLATNEQQRIGVVPVLKGFHSLDTMRELFLKSGLDVSTTNEYLNRVDVLSDFSFGGYARYTDALIAFIRSFKVEFGISLDPVYTGKAMFALWELIEKGALDGKNVLFIHTGGLQGIPGIEEKLGEPLFQ